MFFILKAKNNHYNHFQKDEQAKKNKLAHEKN